MANIVRPAQTAIESAKMIRRIVSLIAKNGLVKKIWVKCRLKKEEVWLPPSRESRIPLYNQRISQNFAAFGRRDCPDLPIAQVAS
jgi:hypothetical protein